MATRTSTTLLPDCSVQANLRGWAQFIEDTFVTTGGWVVTGDTGQTTPGTLTVPGGGNEVRGYRVYTMNDALQATSPVYLKMEYGSGTAVGRPGIWVTIGTGSDGAGNITGKRFGRWQFYLCQTGSATVLTNNSYGSADTNRCAWALWNQATSTYRCLFSVEREKNASGADVGTGLYVSLAVDNGIFGTGIPGIFAYVKLGAPAQPSIPAAPTFSLQQAVLSAAFGGNVGIGTLFHFDGHVAKPYGSGLTLVQTNDVASDATFTVSVYGSTRTYMRVAMFPLFTYNMGGNWGTWAVCNWAVRYD